MVRPIKTEEEYQAFLARTYHLMQLELTPNSKVSDELELRSILIEQYEKKVHPVDPPHPIEAILFRLDQMNMKRSELARILGNRSRASEILSGKRKLSLSMIRKLNKELKIPAEVLINEYEVVPA